MKLVLTARLSLTVDQLLRGASSYASALTRAKIQPGEVIVLILQHGEDLAYAFWGTILHDAIRLHVTKTSAIALRHVKVVDPKWILKTSSGKTARSANKEKFLKELN